MEVSTINAAVFAKMFLAGAKNLEAKKEWINELNVFPVPDGDTGTNMSMTIMSAAKAVSELENPTMKELAKAISSGSLRGARGNSGVILSQLFRGFTKVIAEYDELDVVILTEAMQKAVETAYKAVMKPKEGTILTVAKGAANKALELCDDTDDIVFFVDEVIKEADHVLSKTPDMLPVLKQAGVVDSGGQGLVQVLKGGYDSLIGKEIDYSIEGSAASAGVMKITAETEADIKFGYCTEFIIVLNQPLTEKQEHEYKNFLESIGDSIVVVADDEIVKTHVHTNDPGLAIQEALKHGSLSKIKIDNMREEHQEKLIKDAEKLAKEQKEEETKEEKTEEPRKEMGFISVSIGAGVNEIFNGLGVDYIIEGGQTMNPSTENMLNAIDHVNADNIFILPNNKNIVLAANQAASLVEDKKIIVIPTKTIPQGITALINFIPDQSAEENAERMTEELENVKTGQVTYAVRDTVIDDKEIKQGDYMGIGDKSILAVGKDIKSTTEDMVAEMVDEESAIICIYYGEEVTEEELINKIDKLNNDNIQYINSGIKQQNVEVADVNKKEEYNYTIYTAVLDDLEYFDNIYSDRLIYNTLKVVNRDLVFLIPILVLMLIGLIPVIIIGIGKNNKTEGIALNWYDKILIELAALIAIFIGCIGTVFIVSVNSVSTLVSFIMAMSVIAVGLIIIYLSCIMLFETIVKRIKTHTFVKTTIAYWLYIKIKEFIGDMKITKKLVLYFILFIIANLISFAIMWSDGFSGLVLTIILYAITYAYMAKRVKSYAKINNAIDNLYKGNTDIQLKKEDVCKEMQNIAEKINDIAGGLSNAIEEKLKSERLKTELITNVSHDIKTPLTSIINYVDLLKKEKTDGEKAEEYLNILDNKSQRLKKLTEDLVEASKASAGAIKLNMEKLNVRELIKQVSGEFEDKFKAHQLEEIISFPENDIYIMADSRYMYRILENMYSNISKYAMEGTRVYTDITEKDNNVYIQIKNVSKQKLNISADELMQRFVRGEASRNTEGSGLGLSIARSLTELQQGTFNIYLDGDLFKVTIQFATI